MNVSVIREPAEWQALQPVWNPLLTASSSATTFLTWEWLSAWWTAYGSPGDLWILTATDDAGTLRGVAPLRRQTTRKYGQRYSTLEFVGDGSSDSDYLDFIAEKGFEAPVLDAFWECCREELARGVLLRLNEMPSASPHLPLLKDLAGPRHLWTESAVPCATIQLPESWDSYLGKLKPRFRTKVRSVLRNLEARGDVRFGWCTNHEEVERLLPVLFDLHTRRWNHDGKPGVFGWDRKRRFYFDLSRQLLDRRSLCFSWLEWNGRVLACQYGFLSGDTYLHLQEGYEPASEHWNVGIALRAWTIREFLSKGIREYDFLAGVGRHKMDWGAEVKESYRIAVASPTSRNLLYCHGPEWEERAKESVKRFVPERVLALRKARLDPRTPAAPRSGRELLRKAAAKCYFGIGAPAVAGLVHQRYQLTAPPDGRSGRRSLTRRQEPSGRILYYHRVNDDGDPFFPSLPTAAFERQMRFLARRYQVVSMRRLVDHLESGETGTVFAITFDDGYRDNFENALPILEKYGLPATIFLATGSLDSRDPLWFEILAGAVKATSRECLDREFDVPRRFWLRTPEERLQANGDLFMQLRQMPDAVRQRELDSILRELASPEAAQRRDRMLTWDQVRDMRRRGIEFGGHTVTHPFLSKLTLEQTAWEIGECKRRIEAEVQAAVTHFAYPNGRDEDFSAWNQDALRAAGYDAAVSTIWGLNDASTDRMALRRGGAWEEDEAQFATKMDWYQLVNG